MGEKTKKMTGLYNSFFFFFCDWAMALFILAYQMVDLDKTFGSLEFWMVCQHGL